MSNYSICQHDSSTTETAFGAPALTYVWSCDNCGHERPYTDEDYAGVSYPWTPRAPEGMGKSLAWAFMSREAKFAFYAG